MTKQAVHAVALVCIVLSVGGCVAAAAGEQQAQPLSLAPEDLRAAAERAFRGFDALQAALSRRLMAEMNAGGPLKAVDVCRREARAITAEVMRDQRIKIGRTSDRLRNPGNAPREWLRDLVSTSGGARADTIQAAVVDLGDRVGVARPIGTAGLCTRCHGPAESLAPELTATLREAYPDDRAVGFREGDLRGFFWAEVPKKP